MNRGKGIAAPGRIRGQYGYTIVEVLIFLAVSAVLFGSTMTLLAGRQQRAQFNSTVRGFETKLLDVANDVSSGYFQVPGSIGCNLNGATLNIDSTGTVGKNDACILLGRVIKLGYGGGGGAEMYGIYTLAGQRLSSGSDVASLVAARPQLLWSNSENAGFNNSLVEKRNIGAGSFVACVKLNNIGNCNASNGAIAFVSEPKGGAQSNTTGSAITADVYYYPSHLITDTEGKLVTDTNQLPTKLGNGDSLTICLRSGGTNEHALVTIKDGRILSEISSGACS